MNSDCAVDAVILWETRVDLLKRDLDEQARIRLLPVEEQLRLVMSGTDNLMKDKELVDRLKVMTGNTSKLCASLLHGTVHSWAGVRTAFKRSTALVQKLRSTAKALRTHSTRSVRPDAELRLFNANLSWKQAVCDLFEYGERDTPAGLFPWLPQLATCLRAEKSVRLDDAARLARQTGGALTDDVSVLRAVCMYTYLPVVKIVLNGCTLFVDVHDDGAVADVLCGALAHADAPDAAGKNDANDASAADGNALASNNADAPGLRPTAPTKRRRLAQGAAPTAKRQRTALSVMTPNALNVDAGGSEYWHRPFGTSCGVTLSTKADAVGGDACRTAGCANTFGLAGGVCYTCRPMALTAADRSGVASTTTAAAAAAASPASAAAPSTAASATAPPSTATAAASAMAAAASPAAAAAPSTAASATASPSTATAVALAAENMLCAPCEM